MSFRSSQLFIIILSLAFALPAWAGYADGEDRPKNGSTEVWVGPNAFDDQGHVIPPSDWQQLFDPAHEEEWKEVLMKADVYSFFIDTLKDYPPEAMRKIVALLNRYHVKIEVEAGGTDEWTCGGDKATVGLRSAEIELNKLEPIYQAGGTVSYLALDNPTSRVGLNGRPLSTIPPQPNGCQFPLPEAITQLIQYLKTVRAERPEIKPGLIVNLPLEIYDHTPCGTAFYLPGPGNKLDDSRCFINIGHGGIDYHEVFDSIMYGVKQAGLKLYFQHADNPYSYMINSPGVSDVVKQRLIPLEKQTESYGLAFGLIHNTDLAWQYAPSAVPADPNVQDQLFHDQTLQSVEALQNGGGKEEHLYIESWQSYPHLILPENVSSPPTFMYTVLGAIGLLNQPVTTPPVTTPPVTTLPVTTPPVTTPTKLNIWQQFWDELKSLLLALHL